MNNVERKFFGSGKGFFPRLRGTGMAFLVCGVVGLVFSPVPAAAGGTAPMVEKHIFSPDETAAVKSLGPRSEAASKLEKELVFTGVISTPGGKWAIIRPVRQKKREEGPWRFKEGDEVNGHRIKEIGPNYVILLQNDKPIRLALYQGNKKRPAPPPPEMPPVLKPGTSAPGRVVPVPAGGSRSPGRRKTPATGTARPPGNSRPLVVGQPGTAGRTPPSRSQTPRPPTRPQINPLLEAFKHAKPKSGSGTPPVNPFTRMLQQQNAQ